MTVICRTCLKEINDDSVTFYLDSTDSKSATITVRCKLAYCIPEMDLDVVPNAVICNSCFERLTLAHEFKNKCLETEGRIQSYIEQMGYLLTYIDLKDIVEQSKMRPPSFQTADLKPFLCSTDCTSFMPQTSFAPSDNSIKDSSHEITTPTIYDTNRNPIIALPSDVKHEEEPEEKILDIKNLKTLQCDTRNFFAVPKIAQLLAGDQNSYKCSQCNYTASSDLDLKSHEKSHSSQKLHKCSECDYSAPKRQTLIIHMRKHNTDKLFKCNDCDYSTPYKNTFVQHLRTHLGERPYRCTSENSSGKHVKMPADNKPYKCSLCNYRGRLKFDLKAHMREHAGEKPYKCPFCDYSSSHKTNLGYHIRIHTGEKPYGCKMCDYKSSHKVNLRNHMKLHTAKTYLGEKLHSCTFCNYRTSSKISLVQHLMVHTGEKIYKCVDCDYTTTSKNGLEIHMGTHTCEKPYICILCQKMFANVENLQKHMEHHARSSSETEYADTDVSTNADVTESISESVSVLDSTDCQVTPDISNYESAVKTK